MLSEIKDIAHRNQSTLVQDGLGAVAIMVILLAALHLPALV